MAGTSMRVTPVAKALAWLVLLAGCGGDAPAPAEPPALPPAGNSRWAALEFDRDADGTLDEITLYAYDAGDRRSSQITYAAVAGAPAGAPLRETHWTHDGAGRVVGMTVRDVPAGSETVSTFTYGNDGRLASRRDTVSPAGTTRDTQYTWRDGRLVEAVASGGAGPGRWSVEYGIDGFVSRVVVGGNGYDDEELYRWRSDGSLQTAVFSLDVAFGGAVFSYDLVYDADGRHVATFEEDDGMGAPEMRLSYDGQGRLTDLAYDNLPDSEPGGGFVARRVWRYRWETAPCQPVIVPGLPPHREFLQAGLISPVNRSYGCGP